jgi:pilus assembly protein Flp/PilA
VKNWFVSFWKDDSGQDMAEYALLLVLIAVVIAVAVVTFRDAIVSAFEGATDRLGEIDAGS